MQEDLISKQKVKIYNETIAKQRDLEEKNMQYKEFLMKKQKIEALINEKKQLQERIGKSKRDAEEATLKAVHLKQERDKQQKWIQEQENRNIALTRGNQAIKEKKFNDFQSKVRFEEIHCLDRKTEIKKIETQISRDNARIYKMNEIKNDEDEKERKIKKDQIYKSQPNYVVTCFHNTRIIKHNPGEKTAIERAKEESERLIQRINEEAKIKKTQEEHAEMRGQNAENKSEIDSELKLLEKELKVLNHADNILKIQEGKALPSQGVKPITLERKRQKNEDEFENELKDNIQDQTNLNTKINLMKKIGENLSPNIDLKNPPKLIIKMPEVNQQSSSKKVSSPLKDNYVNYTEDKEEGIQNSKTNLEKQNMPLNEEEKSIKENILTKEGHSEENGISTQKQITQIRNNYDIKEDNENNKEVFEEEEVKLPSNPTSPEEELKIEKKEIPEMISNKPSYIHMQDRATTKKAEINNLRYEMNEFEKYQDINHLDQQTPYFDKNQDFNKNKNNLGAEGLKSEKLPSHILSPISEDQQIDIKTLQLDINKVTNKLNDLQQDRMAKYNGTFGANDKLNNILNSFENGNELDVRYKEEDKQNFNQIRDKNSLKYMEEFLKIGQNSDENNHKKINNEDGNSVLSSVLSSGKKSPLDKVRNEKSNEKYNSHGISNFSQKMSNSPNSELNYSQTDHSPSPYKFSESKLKNDNLVEKRNDYQNKLEKEVPLKKVIVIEIKNEEGFKSLGEDLLNKKKELEERLSKGNQFHNSQTVKEQRTKEDILKYRKEIMKPKNKLTDSKPQTESLQESNISINDRVSQLMNRLAKGEKPQVI